MNIILEGMTFEKLLEICRELDKIDCDDGSIANADLPNFWKAQELARDILKDPILFGSTKSEPTKYSQT